MSFDATINDPGVALAQEIVSRSEHAPKQLSDKNLHFIGHLMLGIPSIILGTALSENNALLVQELQTDLQSTGANALKVFGFLSLLSAYKNIKTDETTF